MKNIKLIITAAVFITFAQPLFSQRNCGSDAYQDHNSKKFPEVAKRLEALGRYENYADSVAKYNQIITIPVVIHIVYKTQQQNISDQEIAKQIKILNDDFSGVNADLFNVPKDFKPFIAGDCKIRFRLEKVFRVKTNKDYFYQFRDDIKFSDSGGHDMGLYSSNLYLNIWVGNIIESKPNDLAGYGTFPGVTPAIVDGVVIHYNVFGTAGNDPNLNKGRTATHEIGHWLGLYHLWGNTYWDDADCADDGISDTPPQQKANFGCLTYPKSCQCPPYNPFGEMFMNYMDYVNDSCMVMFTKKQMERMRANFIPGCPRADIVRGNEFNIANVETWQELKKSAPPVIDAFNKEVLSWKTVDGAVNYTISLKSLLDNTVTTFTTKKAAASIQGLETDKLYEIEVTANKQNDTKTVSNPILIKDQQPKETISFSPQ
ncbi:zinc metalloprotease [Flavobacterium sp. 3HN19-14]|uniref:zinc metalloprotease n=1 Tax=Flavobacterium sp. 3HN19-14 TaxID=3448133 RepID=UPI003EE403FA